METVTLRPLRVEDAEVMATVLGDPGLYAYTGGEPPTAEELTRQYAAQVRGGPADGSEEWLNHLVLLDGEPIGYVQATIPRDGSPTEIAWVIGAPWQGKGHARAATLLLVDHLADRGVRDLVAHIHPDHVASQRIASGLGMTRTDTVVDGEDVWVGPASATGAPATERIIPIPDAHHAEAVALWADSDLTRPWNDPEGDLARALEGPSSTVLAALDGDTLLGTVMVGHDGHRGWVYYLAVRPDLRHGGLGRRLMAAAERWLDERGVPKVQLMVRSTNADVLAFYERLGYVDQDVLVLGKFLDERLQALRQRHQA